MGFLGGVDKRALVAKVAQDMRDECAKIFLGLPPYDRPVTLKFDEDGYPLGGHKQDCRMAYSKEEKLKWDEFWKKRGGKQMELVV